MRAFTFGQLAKQLRLRQELSLRQFCQQNGLDVGDQSKIERDLRPPPASPERRENLARIFGLSPGTEDWKTFFDLADVAAGRIPKDVLEDAEMAGMLPLVFRSLRGEKLSKKQLIEVAELLRRS